MDVKPVNLVGTLLAYNDDYIPAMIISGESFYMCNMCKKIHSSPLGCYHCGNYKIIKIRKQLSDDGFRV